MFRDTADHFINDNWDRHLAAHPFYFDKRPGGIHHVIRYWLFGEGYREITLVSQGQSKVNSTSKCTT